MVCGDNGRPRRRQMDRVDGVACLLPPSFSLVEMPTACHAPLYLRGPSSPPAPIWEVAGRPMCLAMQDCNAEWRSVGRRPGKEIFPLRLTVDTAHVNVRRARATLAENRRSKLRARACVFAMNAEELLPLCARTKRGRSQILRQLLFSCEPPSQSGQNAPSHSGIRPHKSYFALTLTFSPQCNVASSPPPLADGGRGRSGIGMGTEEAASWLWSARR